MARITEFTRDGLTFDVTDAGPLDGPVLVLLHGFPADRSSWRGVAPLLHDAGFRTLAPDQRGYSPRARPKGRAAYRGRELARDVLALMDAAGVHRAGVVGHDWGGIVAWWLAMAAPTRVRHLTAVSVPHPTALRRSLLSSDQALRSSYAAFFQLPLLPERLMIPRLDGLLARSGVPHDFAVDYARRMREPGALTAALDWYRAAALPGGGRPNRDGLVHVPTRYIWSSRDAALGRRAAELTRDQVAGPYEFVELDELHWIPERSPERLAAAILADRI
ncbi:alpha/beta fold hydrolase [Naasia lichenicola]|uniref:Alpha/beta fold hydrolase n=1 Tax=Naasia lichenicola TaxID=2565933 RepID=A0A4S4FQP2_9MICO|nr:alpha/beta fold hydrolase [Naasia lichenicola]THG32889.1 alpha/beta fold hydrolase [Naasia lichenicola]